MKKKGILRNCKWTLCVAFIMYTLEDFTAIELFLWIGIIATVWLFLNLVALLLIVISDHRQVQNTVLEESAVSVDSIPKREFSIPLSTYTVNIQVFRRKEKIKWN